jgi:hypothetical protein
MKKIKTLLILCFVLVTLAESCSSDELPIKGVQSLERKDTLTAVANEHQLLKTTGDQSDDPPKP